LEEVACDKRAMDFLYKDGDHCYFMDPDTYEQIAVPESMVGPQAVFLLPEMRLNIDLVEGRPVAVQFPEMMEVRIADTAPPTHQQQDSTWKPARLENSVEIMVPQFIKTGDVVRLNVENLKYMDRAKAATK
jgi:elongation factor P